MQFFSQLSKLWQIDSSVQIKMFNLTELGIFLHLHLYYLSYFTQKVAPATLPPECGLSSYRKWMDGWTA